MSSAARILKILQLFSDGRIRLRADEVTAHLDVSVATAYRYLADLEQVGLIERACLGEYVLGSSIVELDRVIRENDPLIAASAEIMKTLSDRTGATVLLCRLHGRKVMCVHQVRGRLAPPSVSYERGRAMPLFRGATSKVILAHLPRGLLDEIVTTQPDALRAAGLPASIDCLCEALAAIRRVKVLATRGEVDAQAMGWAVSLRNRNSLVGSLSLVFSQAAPMAHTDHLSDQLCRAALRIEGRLQG